jgi:hypothetical protein
MKEKAGNGTGYTNPLHTWSSSWLRDGVNAYAFYGALPLTWHIPQIVWTK